MNIATDDRQRRASSIDLRLYRSPAAMRVRAAGTLGAANAHLLFKVVVGYLRRHAVPALELDLADVREVDYVGVAAIEDCERYAQRNGVLFTLVGAPAGLNELLNRLGARDLLPPPSRPLTRSHMAAGAQRGARRYQHPLGSLG